MLDIGLFAANSKRLRRWPIGGRFSGEQRDPVYNVARPNRGESTRQSDVRIHCI